MDISRKHSYRPKQAAAMLGICPATLWRWIKERKDFPQPIRLSARCTVIDGEELMRWRDAQSRVGHQPQTTEAL